MNYPPAFKYILKPEDIQEPYPSAEEFMAENITNKLIEDKQYKIKNKLSGAESPYVWTFK